LLKFTRKLFSRAGELSSAAEIVPTSRTMLERSCSLRPNIASKTMAENWYAGAWSSSDLLKFLAKPLS
jgi:hypothetical protein